MSALNDRYLLASLCSFVLALVLTPAVRQFARQRAILDRPNDRSSHAIPVPRVGGTAVVIGTIAGALIAIHYLDWRLALMGIAGLLLAAGGLFDDLRSLSAGQKYVPQVIAAALAALALKPVLVVSLPLVDFDIEGVLASLLAFVWILSFVNVLNFMDGIDGLAAGTSALIAIGVLMLTNGAGGFILFPLAAALIGFLAWNMAPASIFMGDAGSQFIGFILAVGVLHWPSRRVDLVAVAIIFSPLVFDTAYTIVRRALAGKNIFRAHREHLYQRLTALGYTHRAVANLYYGLCAVTMLLAIAYIESAAWVRWGVLFALAVVMSAFAMTVDRIEHGRQPHRWARPSVPNALINKRNPS